MLKVKNLATCKSPSKKVKTSAMNLFNRRNESCTTDFTKAKRLGIDTSKDVIETYLLKQTKKSINRSELMNCNCSLEG